MLSVLYSGGMMMTDAQISVGDLTSFLLYAGFVGISFGGNCVNWPFPRYPGLCFKTCPRLKTFHVKMSLICMKMNL